ncbi:acyltransferase [Bacteroides sp.]
MMIQNSFYSEEELKMIGFRSVGKNVKISKKASLYKPELMTIGNNVRIEDFCVLNGKINIGDNVMLCVFCLLDGHSGITLEDNVTLAAKVSVHSGTDDYSGRSLFGCFVPMHLRIEHVSAPVLIKCHTLIGDSSVIMPGLVLETGTAIGALSFVNKSTEEWSLYAGIPIRKIKDREREILRLYEQI